VVFRLGASAYLGKALKDPNDTITDSWGVFAFYPSLGYVF
jgi:hypothetical protein